MRPKQPLINRQWLIGVILFCLCVNAYAGDTVERFFHDNLYGETMDVILQCAGIYYFCAGLLRMVRVYEGKLNSTKQRCMMTSLGGLCLFFHVTFLSVIGNTLGVSI